MYFYILQNKKIFTKKVTMHKCIEVPPKKSHQSNRTTTVLDQQKRTAFRKFLTLFRTTNLMDAVSEEQNISARKLELKSKHSGKKCTGKKENNFLVSYK